MAKYKFKEYILYKCSRCYAMGQYRITKSELYGYKNKLRVKRGCCHVFLRKSILNTPENLKKLRENYLCFYSINKKTIDFEGKEDNLESIRRSVNKGKRICNHCKTLMGRSSNTELNCENREVFVHKKCAKDWNSLHKGLDLTEGTIEGKKLKIKSEKCGTSNINLNGGCKL